MKTPARLALFLLGPCLAACTPPAAAPTQRASALPPLATGAPRALEALPIGEPVLVSQRLPWGTQLADLDSSGRLALVRGNDGLHVVDVETGQTRGVRGGCADDAGFAPEGHAVVATCQAQKTLRIWDLTTDTTREVALSRTPRRLELARSGGRAAVAGTGGIDVIDLKSGALVTMETEMGRDVTLTVLAAGGRVATSDEAAVLVFEASGKLVLKAPSSNTPHVIDLSPSGRLLAVTDAAGLAIIDVDRGTVRAKVTPCAFGAWHRDVAWTDDELHLVVSCGVGLTQAPARVLMLSPDGAEELELVQGAKDSDYFSIVPRGERLGVRSSTLGGVVFETSTGKELFRVPPPAMDRRAPQFSRDFERMLFHNGGLLEELSVVDRAGRVVGPRLQPSAQSLLLARTAGLLALWGMATVIYFDPATGAARFDSPGELSPDGTTFLVDPARSTESFEIVDRASGARRRVTTDTEIISSPAFSPHGDWVVYPVARSVGAGSSRSHEHLVRLYDAHTGAAGKSFSFGETPHVYSFSDDDKLFAMITDNGRCKVDPKCEVVQVLDVRTGRHLAAISRMRESRYDARFLPGGELFLVDGRVHDARSGRVAWTVPTGAAIDATFWNKGQLLLTATNTTLVVDAATGKTLRELEPLDEVVARSDDGAFVLSRRGHEITLWDSAGWTKKPTTLRLLPPYSAVVLARDGRLAWHVEGGDLLAYRFADGRTLRRATPGFAVDVTDEGVFDPTQIGPGALLARLGPDVERSPMGPSARAAGKLGHPGLFADFVAGKPVSPRP